MGHGSRRRALRGRRLRDAERADLDRAPGAEGVLRRNAWIAVVVGCGSIPALPAAAQRPTIWLDASAAHARPPGDLVDHRAATYGLLGARLRFSQPRRGSLDLSAQAGRGTEREAVGWLGGSAGVETGRLVRGTALGVRAELFGLSYLEPYEYTAYGIAARPHMTASLGGLTATVRADLTRGRWRSEFIQERPALPLPILPPNQPTVVELDGSLAVTGGAVTFTHNAGPGRMHLTAEGYSADSGGELDGWYRGAGAAFTFGVGRLDAAVGGQYWSNPAETEFGYSAAVGVSLTAGLRAQLGVARSVRDPLYGTPGGLAGSFGLSWRIGGGRGSSTPVVEVGEPVTGGRRVRFRLRAPAARSVALAGNFTGWEPRAMQRQGERWTLDVVLAPGVHHFSFVVDGERWMVPNDAPGIVDDGWGRRNASLVIEAS